LLSAAAAASLFTLSNSTALPTGTAWIIGIAAGGFVIAVVCAIVGVVIPIEHASRESLDDREFLQAIEDAASREVERVKPWVVVSGFAAIASVALTAISMISVLLGDTLSRPQVTISLTNTGTKDLQNVCSVKEGLIHGQLQESSEGSLTITPVARQCSIDGKLVLKSGAWSAMWTNN
jgi:hypothetical protein